MVHRSLRAVRACLTVASIAAPITATAQQSATPVAQQSLTAAPQQSAAQAPAAIPLKPPVFNRANERLPAWFRLRGEFRERMEGFDGRPKLVCV